MISELTNARVELERAGMLNLYAPKGSTIECDGGLVWVTQEGEPNDYWLPAGETLVLPRSGRVVIEAAQASRITLQRAESASRWHALLPRFARRQHASFAC
jgi:hypothetical protein